MIALALGRARSELRVGIFDERPIFGGDKPEIVLESQIGLLSFSISDAIVARWASYFTNNGNEDCRRDERTFLVDLRMLDPLIRLNAEVFHIGPDRLTVSADRNRISAASQVWDVGTVIDARDDNVFASWGFKRTSRVLDTRQANPMEFPMLVDMQTAAERNQLLQILPLANSCLMVDTLTCEPAGHSQANFEIAVESSENLAFTKPPLPLVWSARLARSISEKVTLETAAVTAILEENQRVVSAELHNLFAPLARTAGPVRPAWPEARGA